LSQKALGQTTIGQVVNLLSSDSNRFKILLNAIQYLWFGPLQSIVVTCFLWQQIGVSSIIGITVLFIFTPLQGFGKKILLNKNKTLINKIK